MIDTNRLLSAYEKAKLDLIDQRTADRIWVGELASSALSTATAVSALAMVRDQDTKKRGDLDDLIEAGVGWIARRQNHDGGWGDTPRSHSNIATTMLATAALHLAHRADDWAEALDRARRFVVQQGEIPGLRRRYGRDKTFAVPILANCALAGQVRWSEVSPLPFELACFPQSLYRFLQMPVVSYAIPALVAVGQAKFFHDPPRWWWPTRAIRAASVRRSLRVLERMQPASGGYLEAIPLTSFVMMSLAGTGRGGHQVCQRGIEFLRQTVRDDGSWPIDSNLATWNTTLAINALDGAGEDVSQYTGLDWLLNCQHVERHPFTGAAPGGWGWSDLSGAVPDADDTPGALLALDAWLRSPGCSAGQAERIRHAARMGIGWLVDLQNRDGGWPTFCRGWGKLPFDRSGADLTAHALRALHRWRALVPAKSAMGSGFRYLQATQKPDGSWTPLWFGNQDHPDEENPIYGTAKVLLAYRDTGKCETLVAQRGFEWLAGAQNADGGWGGSRQGPENGWSSSVEETAVAVEALWSSADPAAQSAAARGLMWLVEAVESDRHWDSSPIGFYFAKLWYYESLYPLNFTVSALGQAIRRQSPNPKPLAVENPPE